jgi:hypothetical protein
MGIFGRRLEHPLDVPVQRPHDANPHVPERNKRICARYDQGRASGLSFTELGKETAWARRAAGARKR